MSPKYQHATQIQRNQVRKPRCHNWFERIPTEGNDARVFQRLLLLRYVPDPNGLTA